MLKLWARPTSTCTQRVLWTLAEADMPCELILASATMGPGGHIWQGHAPYGIVDTADYRAMNPNGTIPTIDDDGFVLWESNAIVAYLARRYAPERLFGGDEEVFSRALQWMMWTNYSLENTMTVLINHLERLPLARRSPAAVDEARLETIRKLELVEAHLSRSPYFAGDKFSIADIPPGVAIQRWIHCGLERPSMPRLEDWLARIGEREGFRAHVAPRAKHFS